MFDLAKYRRTLYTHWLGQQIDYFEELDSTNTYLKRLNREHLTHGQLCLTDYQSRGRGQYERKWETAAGKNLTFTFGFTPTQAGRFHILTLACARALVEEIESSYGCEALIKWPNDVIVSEKKVAGLLTEAIFSGNNLDRLLVGIGLNVNQLCFPPCLGGKAISLKQLCGAHIDRERLLSRLLSRIEHYYTNWHRQNDDLLKLINKKMIGYGKWVELQINGRRRREKSKLLGINQKGELTAVSRQGDLETFSYEQIKLKAD